MVVRRVALPSATVLEDQCDRWVVFEMMQERGLLGLWELGGHPVASKEGKIAHLSISNSLQSYNNKIQTSEEVKVDNSQRNIQKLVTYVQEH